MIPGVIRVEVWAGYQLKPKAEAENPYDNRDLDCSGYHKNQI